MATNLVSLILDSLTPDIIAKIAAALGLDRGTAQKAVGGAVPALLAALTGVAAKPGGAARLFDAVSAQDPDILTNLAGTVESSGARSLSEQGSRLLGSLLGGSTQSELANTISKFAGITEGKSSSLLASLAPVVMGTLRKQQMTSGLDASGLAGLLSAQKDNISAALPSGLASLLGGTSVLDSLGSRATATAQTTAATAQRVAARTSSLNWLTWAIPVLILLGLAWYFLSPRAPEAPAPTATTTTEPSAPTTTEPSATTTTEPSATTTTEPAAGAAASLTVDGVDLGASIKTAVDGLKTSLEGITDAATAQAALPKLQEASGALEKVNGMAGKLQAEQKSALAALITAALPVINPLLDKALAIPGVSDIIKPAVDSVRAQLDALAKA
jgi:hypothetical protein